MRQRRVFWIVFLLFMFQQKLDGMIGNYKEFFTSQESTLSVEAIDLLPERIFNKQEFCRITGIEENKEISLKTLESAHQLMMLTGRVVGLSFDFSFE